MKTLSNILIILIAMLFIVSCSDSDDGPTPSFSSVFVLNEGNFLSANGSISGYDVEGRTSTQDLFDAEATVQTVEVDDAGLYMITNGPDKLEVLDDNFVVTSSVTEGLDNPIDVALAGNRIYVTNWGDIGTAFTDDPDSYIAVVDLGVEAVVDSILLDHRPQDIVITNNQLFVAHEAANVMTVVDILTLETSEISTPAGTSRIMQDWQGDLWVLCTSGSLIEVNPRDNSISNSISGLTVGGFNEKMAIDNDRDLLYFLGGSNDSFTGRTTVYAVDLTAEILTPEVLIGDGFAFYGIGVDESTGDVYVGDSNAFQSTGTGFRYDQNGTLIDDFATGIGPSGFLFFED